MGKLNFVLTKIIYWPILLCVTVLLSSFEFSPGEFYQGYSDPAFYILVGLALFFIVLYFVIEHRFNKVKLHPLYFPVCFSLAILLITTIWLQGSQTFTYLNGSGEISIAASVIQKTKFSLVIALFLTTIYITLFTFARKQFRVKQIFWFLKAYILFVLIAIIFSAINERDSLVKIFNGSTSNIAGLQSFFYNENLFAMFILFAIFAMFVLNFYHSRPYNYLIIIGLFFYMTLTTCASTFFIGLCAIVIYLIFDAIRNFKRHWILALISVSVAIVFIAAGVVLFIAAYNKEVSWVINLCEYIEEQIFAKDYSTLTGRTEIWKGVFDNLINNDPINLILGRGYGTSSMFLKGLGIANADGNVNSAIISTHNGLINILLNTGLVGLGLYGILILSTIGTCIYLIIKKQPNLSITFGLIVCGVLAHSLLETNGFFCTTMISMVISIMFLCPIFNCARAITKTKLTNQAKEGHYFYFKMQYRKLRRFLSMFIIGLIVPCVTLFSSTQTYQNKNMTEVVVSLLIIFAISWVFIPQLVTMFYKDSTRKRFIFRLIFYPILFVVLFVGASVLYSYISAKHSIELNSKIFSLLLFILYLFVITLIFTLVKKDSIKQYFVDTFCHSVLLVRFALPISLFVGLASNIVCENFLGSTVLTTVELNTIPFILYFVLFVVIPYKEKYYYTNYFNEIALFNLKKITNKYKI